MRLSLLLTLMACVQAGASGLAQITLSARNESLLKVIKTIEKQTNYDFIYSYEFVEREHGVTVEVKNASLDLALESILKNTSLKYSIVDRTVVIAPKAAPAAQQPARRSITGQVTGPNGPIAGASVVVKGSTRGVVTDAEGRYAIAVNPNDNILEITFLGMKKRDVTIGNRTVINVALEEHVSPINDVQVIAYGTTTRKLNTGSVSSIKAAELEKQPVANVLMALQGRMNGMYIEPLSSTPGSNPTVTVRGNSSVQQKTDGTQRPITQPPLFILDGVPIPYSQKRTGLSVETQNELSTMLNINPMDIESIDVLKDADAAALYGSRGANGVVLINTKKGRTGQARVSVNAYTGVSSFPRFLDMWNTDEYMAAREETLKNDNLTPTQANAPDLLNWDRDTNVDWQQELFGRTARTNSLNASVSGGNRNTTFYVNAGYRDEESVMQKGKALTDKTARLNLSHFSDDRKFNMNIIAGIGQYNILLPNTSMIMLNYDLPPNYPARNDDGTPNWNGGRGYPYADFLSTYTAKSNSYNANADLNYEVWKGLRLKMSGGVNSMVTNQQSKTPSAAQNPAYSPKGYMTSGHNDNFGWIMEPQMTYDVRCGKHKVSFLLGGTWEKSYTNYVQMSGSGFTNDAMMSIVTAAPSLTVSESPTEYAYNSLFTRLTYHYDEKYLLNLSYRRDGSSRFGVDRKFGNFGAIGAAWIFSSEPFVADNLPALSFGKLRASWGVLGNDNIGDYKYASTYDTYGSGTSSYGTTTLKPTTIANPSLQWEESKKLEIAMELGFLHDRFMVSASRFRNRIDNQLVDYKVSQQSGFTKYTRNFPALVQNTGWEFEVNTRNIDAKDFKWATHLNFSWSDNKLVEFPDIEASSYASTYIVGKSLNLIRAYKYEKMNENGVPVLADLDNSGSITSTGDRYVIGDSDPRFGGMTNTFTYKNIDFTFFIQYERYFGVNTVLPSTLSPVRTGRNMTTWFNDRWQKPGDEATANFPRFTSNNTYYNYSSFYRQSDVNYGTTHVFRLSNVSLQYTLPHEWTAKVKIERLQVYVLGQNLYTWDKMRKYRFDPITGNLRMPQLRTWTFGINCTF